MNKQGMIEKQETNISGILNLEGNNPILEINGEMYNLIDALQKFDGKDVNIIITNKKETMTE